MNAGKSAELHIILPRENPDVVFLTETKLTEDILTSQFLDCNSYQSFRRDRGKGRGGGVLMMVKNGLNVRELPEFQWKNVEAITCELKLWERRILLVCAYRPNSASQETNNTLCHAMLQISNSKVDQLLVCGDFNYRD